SSSFNIKHSVTILLYMLYTFLLKFFVTYIVFLQYMFIMSLFLLAVIYKLAITLFIYITSTKKSIPLNSSLYSILKLFVGHLSFLIKDLYRFLFSNIVFIFFNISIENDLSFIFQLLNIKLPNHP